MSWHLQIINWLLLYPKVINVKTKIVIGYADNSKNIKDKKELKLKNLICFINKQMPNWKRGKIDNLPDNLNTKLFFHQPNNTSNKTKNLDSLMINMRDKYKINRKIS